MGGSGQDLMERFAEWFKNGRGGRSAKELRSVRRGGKVDKDDERVWFSVRWLEDERGIIGEERLYNERGGRSSSECEICGKGRTVDGGWRTCEEFRGLIGTRTWRKKCGAIVYRTLQTECERTWGMWEGKERWLMMENVCRVQKM